MMSCWDENATVSDRFVQRIVLRDLVPLVPILKISDLLLEFLYGHYLSVDVERASGVYFPQ